MSPPSTHLNQDTRDLILLYLNMLDTLPPRFSLHELHRHPEIGVLYQIRLEEVDDGRVQRLLHDHDLVPLISFATRVTWVPRVLAMLLQIGPPIVIRRMG
jgi:hypothetical protein